MTQMHQSPTTTSKPTIFLRVTPNHGLTLRTEDGLACAITRKLEERGLELQGAQLAGTVIGDRDLSLDDVVTLLLLFLVEPAVALVEVSFLDVQTVSENIEVHVRVHASHTLAVRLCELHHMRLLDAESVVRALAGSATRTSQPDQSPKNPRPRREAVAKSGHQ